MISIKDQLGNVHRLLLKGNKKSAMRLLLALSGAILIIERCEYYFYKFLRSSFFSEHLFLTLWFGVLRDPFEPSADQQSLSLLPPPNWSNRFSQQYYETLVIPF